MAVHCLESGCIRLYIPSDLEISLGPRDVPRASPSGHLSGLGKSLGRRGCTTHSLIIGREVSILKLYVLLAPQGCISWYIPRDGLMMREWPYTASREISWSSGINNPIHPSSRQCTDTNYKTLHLLKEKTVINMGLITHWRCKASEFFTTIQPNLEQNIYISFMYVSDYFTKHRQSFISSRRREESRWQRWCEAWLSRVQSWDLTELQKWILWSIRY